MSTFTEESHEVFAVNLFSARVCQSIVDRLSRSRSWSHAKVRKHFGKGKVRSIHLDRVRCARILDPARAAQIYDGFERSIDRKIKPLIKNLWQVDLREHAGTQIIHYAPHGHYQPHTDSGLDLNDRYFSVLCYLNDDFEGGCTFFPYLNYRATPKSGRAIVFPSRFMHCAEPVLKGEKYVALTWVMGPMPIQWL